MTIHQRVLDLLIFLLSIVIESTDQQALMFFSEGPVRVFLVGEPGNRSVRQYPAAQLNKLTPGPQKKEFAVTPIALGFAVAGRAQASSITPVSARLLLIQIAKNKQQAGIQK